MTKHQIASLSLETRLNIGADKLATEYMQEDRTHRPTAALFPSAKVQLIIKDVSITRKIPMVIRSAAGSLGIRTYLQERNTWSEATLNNVHWDTHGASHSYHRPHRCYLVKLCHRHLPLGQTLDRRDNKYPSTCPGYRIDPETQSHHIQCKAPSRMLWRTKHSQQNPNTDGKTAHRYQPSRSDYSLSGQRNCRPCHSVTRTLPRGSLSTGTHWLAWSAQGPLDNKMARGV
jgi:hypothetical protein